MDARADPVEVEDAEPTTEEINNLVLRIMRGVNGQAFRLFGNRVLTGPFAGMIIPERNAFWDDGNSGTKLLGTYEHELHPVIDHACWRRPRSIINVGCAEGFYAIGLARLLPNAVVHAFDIRQSSLELCAEYAALNGVADRISIKEGVHTPQQLQLHTVDWPRLYLIDVEGAEHALVDLERCPALAHSDLIIECHDFLRGDISSTIADRLSTTHRVEVIKPRLPDLEQFPFLRGTPSIMSVLVAVEKRPMPCLWLGAWANRKGICDG